MLRLRYQDIGEEDDWETADRDSGDDEPEAPAPDGTKPAAKKLKTGKARAHRRALRWCSDNTHTACAQMRGTLRRWL